MAELQLLALHNIDERMLRLLIAESVVFEKKPQRMSNAFAITQRAMRVCLNAHERGGCTYGQIQEIEACIVKMEGTACA